ncbi:MAG: hypothetical protein E7678_04775 [Ruminococcaceae bacterium]|nr:hypothetical protein [Oscillospiraceae bacterium]
MNKKVLTVFSIILTLVIAFASILIFDAYLDDADNISLLIIFAFFSLITIVMILTIIFDVFIGCKDLIFEKDKIIVGRKGKMTYTISKNDIDKVSFTYDSYNNQKCILSFDCDKKKYYVSVTKWNKRAIDSFFADVKHTKHDSTVGYFVLHILEVFS